jgi:hypothetical protein
MPASRDNPPHLSALTYRLGTHPTILRRLLERLPTQAVPPDETADSHTWPLAALTSRDTTDPAIALLDGWAVIADVVTFYQERIAHEGYLRTATEFFSVHELTRTLGYALQPGLAASTSLVFMVETAPGMGDRVHLAPGIKVQSIPGQDQQPQTFETVEVITARPEWNLLRPHLPLRTVPQMLTTHATELRLAGTGSGLRPGDRLLLVSGLPDQSYVPAVQAVQPDATAGVTRLLWGTPLATGNAAELTQPGLFALRQRATLFGRHAPMLKRPEGGVFRRAITPENDPWMHAQEGLPEQAVQALLAYRLPENNLSHLLAATAGAGIFRSSDGGISWQPCNRGLSILTVYSLCIDNVHALYAGTADGAIFRSLDNGDTWVQWASGALMERTTVQDGNPVVRLADYGLPKTPIHALCAVGTQLYAGTDDGVYAFNAGNAQWQRVGQPQAIRALIVQPETTDTLLGAGAAPGTLFTLATQSQTWAPVRPPPPALAGLSVRALANIGTGTVFAGTSAGIYRRQDNNTWIGPLAQSGMLDVDVRALAVDTPRLVAALPPGRLIEQPWPSLALPPGPNEIDLDTTYAGVLVGSSVALVNQDQVTVSTVTGVTTVSRTDFEPPTMVTRLQLTLPPGHGLAPFYGLNLRSTEVFFGSEPLTLFEPAMQADEPVPATRMDGTQQVQDITLDQQVPALETGRRLVVRGTPSDAPTTVSEVVFVAGTRLDQDGRSIITLCQPGLQHRYAPATVTIHANVALATHGETIADEVLGSGDGTQQHQRFTLKHTPLTYVPAPTESGARSTLSVRVNGVLWDEVPSLHDQDAQSRSYIVRQDAQGRSSLTFGDGQRGARLPSGRENVVATYRSGLGPDGEVNANSLALLQTRPLGVREVTNPLPATGAAASEPLDQARQHAPLTVMTLGRIVALADFAYFTQTFAGIGMAQATLLRTPAGSLVHLTIADSQGDPVLADSALYLSLVQAIEQRRNRLQPMQIDSYVALEFDVAATVYMQPRYTPEAVEQAVRSALQAAMAFGKRAFGQAVSSAEVITLIQGVPGVVAVALERLCLTASATPATDPCPDILPARRARWLQGRVMPAELLVLKTITLQMEMTA